MSDVVFFPGDAAPDVSIVGGKAASLIRMCAADFNVPSGAVLTVEFFAPWFDAITSSDAWARLVGSDPADWRERCEEVKALVAGLPLDAVDGFEQLEGERFAVRSSSPDEDLGTASFAGGYETHLGVTRDGLDAAIRACFASSLDARILHYKRQHGFDPFAPRIAVVIQQQIDSEVAGVGFSLNPLTNDYDEAVFDASWGLGESVVSGAVSPDHFVVDRVTGEPIAKELGAKASSLHLGADGTEAREGHRSEELCLDDAQLAELSATIGAVEDFFAKPVDIEFAYAEGRLFILQARPITTWVPLHPSMRTEPGARRRLYMDAALSGGLATNTPFSPIGQSFFERFAALMIHNYVGELPWELGPGDEVAFLCGGRLYAELSNVLWLVSPKFIAKNQENLDALMAATLANIDRKRYRAERRPIWVSPWAIVLYLRGVWAARAMIWNMLRTIFSPRAARARYDREVDAFATEFEDVSADGTIDDLLAERGRRVITHVLNTLMAGLLVSMIGMSLVEKIVPKRRRELTERLTRGFEGNVVVDMGAALHRMSKLLDPADLEDPCALADRLEAGEAPAFAAAWTDFVAQYGWRGPSEVDLGAPRYQDEPVLALQQMCAMAQADFDPTEAHAQHVRERGETYEQLMRELGFVRRFVLKRAYRWIDQFAGTRDTPKHQYLMLFAAARARVMRQGHELAAAGRLDAAEDVLDLTIDDIARAEAEPTLDLRALCAVRTEFVNLLRDVVKGFPPVIDSRGRIIRPAPRAELPGEATGMAVSPGVARGPAKVLTNPYEKPVEPGDILIAHTTDPGWTPLFINAAAVVLEVGGVLQHGAVVAREYGKPCVAGITNVLTRFEDGELLEVDGTTGVVRQLANGHASSAG